ncbi:hypothetical protein K2173_014713 [Erythroxylum novogranatense]|uniref:DUF4283 domain-containing protein n=1 Tax=Erythroxylum novogranatense TaxID=1862640 RepID=A0AAV8TFJ9_9ROSI|nr:hypothetical protein K2173_014713 [Erythroxylum novogranatense]
MKSDFNHLSLSDEEDQELIIKHPESSTPVSYAFCLVGIFLTYDRINFQLMREVFVDPWNPLRGILIFDWGAKLYLFKFFNAVDLERVISGAPWLFNKQLLFFSTIKSGEDSLLIPLLHVDVWVEVCDLKLGFMNEIVVSSLGNFIGSFLEYDTTCLNIDGEDSFMKIRVHMDIQNPLKRKKKLVDFDGNPFYITFRYQRIQIFCYFCGKLVHIDSFYDLLLHHKKEDLKPF